MDNEACRDELDGPGVCFRFTKCLEFLPGVNKHNKLYPLFMVPASLIYQSIPQHKTQQLAYVLWFTTQICQDATPQAISALYPISHLNSENAYLKKIHFNNETFILIMTFFQPDTQI